MFKCFNITRLLLQNQPYVYLTLMKVKLSQLHLIAAYCTVQPYIRVTLPIKMNASFGTPFARATINQKGNNLECVHLYF